MRVVSLSRSILVLLLPFSLAACGGGSSTAGPAPALAVAGASAVAEPAAQVLALQGGGTLTIAADGSGVLQPGGGGSYAFAPLTGAAPANLHYAGGTVLAQQGAGQAPDFALETMAGTAGLSASDFGVWSTYAMGSPTATQFYAGGQPTPAALLPQPGSGITATYGGSYIATLSSNTVFAGQPLAAGPFSGSVQLTANFNADTIQAVFGGLLSGTATTTSSINPASGSYTATGGSFSPYAPASYALKGAFYGTGAAGQAPPETVGTMSGTIGAITASSSAAGFTGAFGAHR